jgi:transposase
MHARSSPGIRSVIERLFDLRRVDVLPAERVIRCKRTENDPAARIGLERSSATAWRIGSVVRARKRRAKAADRAQTETVRTEYKVPIEQRTCPSCGNDKLKPIGNGRTTAVYEFVPARLIRHEHVQAELRCRCRTIANVVAAVSV